MAPSQWNTQNATFGVEDSWWSWLTLMVEPPFGSLNEVFWEATGPSLFMTPFLQRRYLTLTCPKAHRRAGNHWQHCAATGGGAQQHRVSSWMQLAAGMSCAQRSLSDTAALQSACVRTCVRAPHFGQPQHQYCGAKRSSKPPTSSFVSAFV